MKTTAPKPVTTPIPVQLSEPEFDAFILPHLSMPKRGPKGKLGYHRVLNLPVVARLLGAALLWPEVVQRGQPTQQRLLGTLGRMQRLQHA